MPCKRSRSLIAAGCVHLVVLTMLVGCTSPRKVRTLSELNHPGPLQERVDVDLGAIEHRIFQLVNEERGRRRQALLTVDDALASLARQHSADMATNGYFDHTNLRGLSPTQRGEAIGLECVRPAGDNRVAVGIGENIFSTYLFTSFNVRVVDGQARRSYDWKSVDALAGEAVDGWMNSRGHRLNLLSPQYRSMGIGAAYDAEGQLFVTQNFC